MVLDLIGAFATGLPVPGFAALFGFTATAFRPVAGLEEPFAFETAFVALGSEAVLGLIWLACPFVTGLPVVLFADAFVPVVRAFGGSCFGVVSLGAGYMLGLVTARRPPVLPESSPNGLLAVCARFEDDPVQSKIPFP